MKHNFYISKAIRFVCILTIFATIFALTSCCIIPVGNLQDLFPEGNNNQEETSGGFVIEMLPNGSFIGGVVDGAISIIVSPGKITDGFTEVVDYTVTERDMKTGNLVIADENHKYDYFFSADELEVIGAYRNNNLPTDEEGNAIGKYYMNSQSQMKLTKEAMAAAHSMLVDAEKAVQKDDLLIAFTYGYNEADNEEYNTALLIYLTNYENGKLDGKYKKWFNENAAEYGFIESFEDGYRYVGVAHAKSISGSKDITSVADYVKYLKENTNVGKTIEIEADGATYKIYYAACTAGESIKVPAKYDYTLSGTNEGGIIVTVKIK